MNTAKILKLLEQYIDRAVENRWERTRDFIRLLKLYSDFGHAPANGKV